MTRLPTPGSDNGTWGSILNDFLSQVHASDGTLKTDSVTSDAIAPNAVTSAAIAPNSITSTALASNAVNAAIIADGSIVNANINASAGIVDTKLATISTTGKVSNSATTATSANTASAIVARDASGNFSANTINAALSGNAATATKLVTTRTINGVPFDGTADITVADSTKEPVRGQIFHVDDYGADPTGATFSDAAVISAYNALVAAGKGIIVFGVGKYKLSSGLNDDAGRCIGPEQGAVGQGSGLTIIDYRGTGACFEFRNKNYFTDNRYAGGCYGIQIWGWNNNNASSYGVRYGDIYHMRIVDVLIGGFRKSGCIGLYADNQIAYAERGWIDVVVDKCTECVVFKNGSFDYSTYVISLIADVDQNGVVLFSDGTHPVNGTKFECIGVSMTIQANCNPATAPATNSGVLFMVGRDDTDKAQLSGTLNIYAETSTSTGTVGHKDINLGVTKFGAQAIVNCVGAINLSGNNCFRKGTATPLRFGFTGSLRNSPTLGTTGNVSTFQSLQVLNQARGQTNLANSTYTLYLETGNIFEIEPNAGTYGIELNVGSLTSLSVGNIGSPFGVTVVDLWIRQPSNGTVVAVNNWFTGVQSFVWADGVKPTLNAAPGQWDVIRLTSLNFASWVGQYLTKPAESTGTIEQYWRGDKTWQTLDKSAVGLSNVDNTSDSTKNTATATLTNKTLTNPRIGTSVLDINGNTLLGLTATGSAVNYLTLSNAATGYNASLTANGTDANVGIGLVPKGSGLVDIFVATGQTPTLRGTGADANHNFVLQTKGTGSVILRDGSSQRMADFNGVTSAVNRLAFYSSATGNPVRITAAGSDTNVGINLVPQGTGIVQIGGVQAVDVSTTQTLTNKTLTNPKIGVINDVNNNTGAWIGGTASAVNFLQLGNAATTGRPLLRAQGETNVGLGIVPKGTGSVTLFDSSFKFVLDAYGTANAANYISVSNSATGSDPFLLASGSDTDIGLNLRTIGAGTVKINGAEANRRTVQTVTTATTLSTNGDYIVFVGASGAPTLPTAVNNTSLYRIKNIDNVNRTISTTSSQTIEGSTTYSLAPGSSVQIVSDGSNWRVI